MVKNLELKLEIIKKLDKIRWQDRRKSFFEISYYIDYVQDNLSASKAIKNKNFSKEIAEEILFTHYLLYICDKQMDYRHIFKLGGYVISNLVKNKEKFSVNSLKLYNNKLCLEAPLIQTTSNKLEYLKQYSDKNKKKVLFSSYKMIDDFQCIYKTIMTLREKYDSSFGNFLKSVLDNSTDINKFADELYNLTYSNLKTIKKSDNNKNINIEEIKEKIEENYNDNKDKNVNFHKVRFKSKRLWCIIRDFLYHPIFKKCFKKLAGKKYNDLFKQVEEIELPGDTWNNNINFIKCFWGKDINITNSSKFLRDQYKNNKKAFENSNCIPIYFDITFNFVPKMCKNNYCHICPLEKFKEEHFEKNYFNSICHNNKGKACSFVLYATDIYYKCNGINKCIFRKNLI